MTGIYIEWLKSRRTKSFSIVAILIVVATLWNIATFSSAFSHPELKTVGTLFSNQNVNLLMFPIAVCVFAARIVGNEREGQTFRLQAVNGQHFLTIFNHKFLICIYLTLAMVLERQGILLALGLLGGFSGIVLNPRSYGFISLLNPITGFGSLAPYKYQFLGDGAFTYSFDEKILWKLVVYAVYCALLYGLANIILKKRGS